MARPIFADPRSGFVLNRIFGSEVREHVSIAFLNTLLVLEGERRIVSFRLLAPEPRPRVKELKLSTVHAQCRDARGVTYVVKMQVLEVEGFEKRLVYDVAKSRVRQLPCSKPYLELNDLVGISICDFEVWPDEEGWRIPMLSRWYIPEDAPELLERGQIHHILLELPKYDTSRPPRTDIEKWAYFFREVGYLSVIPEPLSEQPFVEAIEASRIARFTIDDWDLYTQTLLAVMDQRSMLAAAEQRGLQLGRAHRELLRQARGEATAEATGEAQGEPTGGAGALRHAIEHCCGAYSIDLTTSRRVELESMDAAGLSSLLSHLYYEQRWPLTLK